MGEVPLYINDLCSRPRRARPETVLTAGGVKAKAKEDPK